LKTDGIAIPGYSSLYCQSIITFPNAQHIFDYGLEVEARITASPIELFGKQVDNYKFVDSKDEKLVQVSDLAVGISRMWKSFLEANEPDVLGQRYSTVPSNTINALRQFQHILQRSLNTSTDFKWGSASKSFELKIARFMEYDFTA
jgi:hypothetical protein